MGRRASGREGHHEQEERERRFQEHLAEKRRRQEELGIRLPEPLKPWGSMDTLSKRVIPFFEKGEHPLTVAKKLNANKNTVRSYWFRWRQRLGI